MFKNARSFNGDISGWDTSAATNFYWMFYKAESFDGDISGWDTSAVTNFREMFNLAKSFNTHAAGLNNWDTSASTTFRAMFQDATAFSQRLCWGTSGVNIQDTFLRDGGGQFVPSWSLFCTCYPVHLCHTGLAQNLLNASLPLTPRNCMVHLLVLFPRHRSYGNITRAM